MKYPSKKAKRKAEFEKRKIKRERDVLYKQESNYSKSLTDLFNKLSLGK